ncbi:ABC transporter permease [Lentzea atacamensis]|nr:DUF4175 domain-containing protein [Lentzea atacamensis]
MESVVLCLAGVVLGLLGTAGYAAAHGWPAVIPVEIVSAGLAAAVLTGVYPAVRASRPTPTEALAAP